jgi:hypothetical protein
VSFVQKVDHVHKARTVVRSGGLNFDWDERSVSTFSVQKVDHVHKARIVVRSGGLNFERD